MWVPGERPTKPLSPVKFRPRDEELEIPKSTPAPVEAEKEKAVEPVKEIEKPDEKMGDVEADIVQAAKPSEPAPAAPAPLPDAMEGVVDAQPADSGKDVAKQMEIEEAKRDEITPQDPMETEAAVQDSENSVAKKDDAAPAPAPTAPVGDKVVNSADVDTDATMRAIPAENGQVPIAQGDSNMNIKDNSNAKENANNDSNGADAGAKGLELEGGAGKSQAQEKDEERDQVAPMDDVGAETAAKNEGACDENENKNNPVAIPATPTVLPSSDVAIEQDKAVVPAVPAVPTEEKQESKEGEKGSGEEPATAAKLDQGITIGEEEAPEETPGEADAESATAPTEALEQPKSLAVPGSGARAEGSAPEAEKAAPKPAEAASTSQGGEMAAAKGEEPAVDGIEAAAKGEAAGAKSEAEEGEI